MLQQEPDDVGDTACKQVLQQEPDDVGGTAGKQVLQQESQMLLGALLVNRCYNKRAR